MILRVFAFAPMISLGISLSLAAGLERGTTVVNLDSVELRDSSGRSVERIGPGEVFLVLDTRPGNVLVSRGQPGWVDRGKLLSLVDAETCLESRFRDGAGPADYLARGNIRIARGKTELGLSDLRNAVELSGNPAAYLPGLGFGLLRAKQHVEAIETFTRALDLDRGLASAHLGRGLAYFQSGQLTNALADFSAATRLASQNAIAHKYAGIVSHDLGKLGEATEFLTRSLRLDPYDAHTHRSMGRLDYEKGKLSDAMASFESAIKLDPKNAEGFAGRGVVGFALGDNLQRVQSDYLRAIGGRGIRKDNAYLYANLGQVQWELGEIETAIQNLDAAIQIDPGNNEAISVRILARIDQLTEANRQTIVRSFRDDLTRIFKQSFAPTYWDYRALAAVNALLGDKTRAVRFQRLAVEEASRSPNKRFRESALATLSRYSEAKPDKPNTKR